MKIGVQLGHGILIYPVRLAFHRNWVHSFASKDVVIPAHQARDFTWEDASIGNVCVASDGSCSLFLDHGSRHAISISHAMTSYFPRLMNAAWRRILAPSSQWGNKRWRMLASVVAPFEVKHLRQPFTVFVREADL